MEQETGMNESDIKQMKNELIKLMILATLILLG